MIKKSLVPLALGGFGIGMTEFVIMGILPDIATGLQISIPQAGYLITAYALGVVVGAPTLVSMLAHRPPRSVLMWFMLMFTVFNAMSAFAPNFEVMMLSRFMAGLPHGAFFGVGSVVAARLADEGKVAAALATMFTGLTLANVIGVPAGTWLGHNLSWRAVFLVVALIGLATVFALRQLVPHIDSQARTSLRHDLRIFRSRALWLALAITSIGTGGFFAFFSYIAPLLTEVTRFKPSTIPMVMTVVGVGMTVGVLLGGRLADRVPPLQAILILLASMTVLLLCNGLFAGSQPAMLVLAFATGANALALGPPIQMLLMEHSREAEMLGSSLGQSGFNVGNATGAFLGGIPLTLGYSYASPQWVAAGLALAGVGLALAMLAHGRARALVPA
ncbi:MFS transporter [Massilia yuzhufengensis]|uniref:MFS transporter, DHA1 family, arabinose polymer transporter n=1 Tax=Massilia yuzhufengensis TaxID=1164594 RepID=A0A1I1I6Y8_9BURK|nr:MFS transporter [Massilia yuzhufengensis]SFC29998.1 MFS transporter, DHA1 family, arabinose polymer transporter [Massilia yuzhufengensis]